MQAKCNIRQCSKVKVSYGEMIKYGPLLLSLEKKENQFSTDSKTQARSGEWQEDTAFLAFLEYIFLSPRLLIIVQDMIISNDMAALFF